MLRECLALIALLQLAGGVARALPTIQGGNARQQLDKSFFQPPEIEQTIDEVQKILANDPALPRLTRGEIEELYEKVTREEYEKSLEAGDMSRADSMRALMLVLPFNTDNNTEENLQELYTRPPVTRVIDAYTPPDPVKFLTPDPSALPRSTVPGGNPAVAATTYKPPYGLPYGQGNLLQQQQQFRPMPAATTYHPPAPPPVVYQDFKPLTAKSPSSSSPAPNLAPSAGGGGRFSSHYSAKNAQFLRKPKPVQAPASSTVKPVADILESLGIVSGGSEGAHKRYALDDYYPAESAPQPSVVAVADLRGLQGARIRPEAYSNFKPLNIGEELRVKPEVEGYLTRFGIVKKPKALKKEAKPTEEPTGAHTELSTATAKLPLQGNAELAKLLENLQELERLQAQQAKRKPPSTTTTTTTPRPTTTSTTTTTTTTTTPAPVQLITHGEPMLIEAKKPRRRIDPNIDLNFANGGNQQATSTNELSKLLQNLQELEKLQINPENVIKAANPSPGLQALSSRFTSTSTTTSSTTTTTTPSPAQREALELQRILKQLQQLEQKQRTTTTSTTTSTTSRPAKNGGLGLGAADLLQLQRLLSDDRELEKLYEQARNGAKKKQLPKTTTTSTTTSTTTTTTTTPRPTASVDHAQFEALITRVQQLEQLQQPTTPPNFLTRNIAGSRTSSGVSLPSNDFAHLQDISPTASSLPSGSGGVEISTAASTSKQRQRPLNNFERSNGLLLQDEVHPQDYVQLQKLLSKVQELERVQLKTADPHQQLVTAASVRTPDVKSLQGAHIVYAQPAKEQDLVEHEPEPELKLDLPVYKKPLTPTPVPSASQTSSEELRELAMSQPAHPTQQKGQSSGDFGQLQQFFSGLEDVGERQSYQHMQPIYKTVPSTSPPAPPRFVPSKKVTPLSSGPRKADLEELQKLLYNTQQLQKLGVALPHELSQQLESQLQATSSSTSTSSSTTSTTPAPTHDTSSPAVFSLTTIRPRIRPIPEPRPSTESSLELPVFSATKIIEAAIKRAANRIGVSTELAPITMGLGVGFRRRSDDVLAEDDLEAGGGEAREGELDGDLMAEFSELNYQLAKPETPKEKRENSPASGGNLSELQRLISNLQELQQLNVSLDKVKVVTPTPSPDAAYLQSLQNGQDETLKSRRQSEKNETETEAAPVAEKDKETPTETEVQTTQAPTKISLSLGLDDGDIKSSPEETESSTSGTTTTTTTTEEPRNGSIDDLADSFGPDPVSEEPPPPKKKNGFYFLADWNSFLEVGDGDDQVVVRLSPKIGDPRLFLPVKIPSS
ncbi:uncharacterized protein Dana_GF22173, isoform B [Drosophila ananassae]|uniref:Uncharacterized protein, isoform A n=1 Tax=Drosophila ananassae TaxID=7217 RepID=B3MYM5_DROAN|nr:flocculation protein FLO11 [Drosophila ananassae]XP_014759827.1 flocculation protein FLO11 [Drosophila ananassae]EDV32719.1 uncharacterized protein Dana_GF22173, isoform A [Drosophila ananassae]KPU74105.1 uncharacterized protein Dana_GF22173, isoform B [Drosophila ananassae]